MSSADAEAADQRALGEVVAVAAPRCTARWRRATASCACTTSMLLATPAAKRSRACVSCCAARSRARVATCSCSLRGLQIEKRRPHFVVDRRLQVLGFGAAAAQVGVGFEEPAARAAALEDRDVDGAADRVGGIARRRRQADVAVVGVDAHRRQRVRRPRPARVGFGGADPLERGLVVFRLARLHRSVPRRPAGSRQARPSTSTLCARFGVVLCSISMAAVDCCCKPTTAKAAPS